MAWICTAVAGSEVLIILKFGRLVYSNLLPTFEILLFWLLLFLFIGHFAIYRFCK